jgi:hypothetical protein
VRKKKPSLAAQAADLAHAFCRGEVTEAEFEQRFSKLKE